MFDSIKNFFKSTIVYGLVGSFRSFSEFLLLPLYSRYLVPAEFGTLDVVMVAIALSSILVVFELHNAAFRFYFDDKTFYYRKRLVSTVTIYLSSIALIVAGATVIFASEISSLLFGSPGFANLFILAALFLFFNSIFTFPLNLFRLQDKPFNYTAISLVQIALSIGGIIYFVAMKKMGVQGVLLAKVGAMIPTLLYCLWAQRDFLGFKIDFELLKKLTKFSAPLIPAGSALWGINALNRYFLLKFTNLEQIGLFSMAMKFTILVTLSVMAFQLAWPQFAFARMENREAGKTFSRIFTYYAGLATWMVLFIALFGRILLAIQSTEIYFHASEFMFPLALGTMLYGCFYIFSTGVSISKKTTRVLWPLGIGLFVNIFGHFMVTSQYGAEGAAWVTTATYFSMTSVMFVIAQRHFYLPLEWPRLVKLALITIFTTIAAVYLPDSLSSSNLIYRGVLLISFPMFLLILGFFDESERKAVMQRLVLRRGIEYEAENIETEKEQLMTVEK